MEKELSSQEIDRNSFAEKSKEYSDLNDIIGEAVAKEQGNAFNMKYKMDLDLGFGELRVNFNDWMFRIDESTIINKATINKFGVNIATVTLFFRKKN